MLLGRADPAASRVRHQRAPRPDYETGFEAVRWAAIEACQRTRPGTKLAADRTRIITARGRNIGVVAAARRLLTLVYYGLRDGEIRTLAARAG